jgi:hypothetical protein
MLPTTALREKGFSFFRKLDLEDCFNIFIVFKNRRQEHGQDERLVCTGGGITDYGKLPGTE